MKRYIFVSVICVFIAGVLFAGYFYSFGGTKITIEGKDSESDTAIAKEEQENQDSETVLPKSKIIGTECVNAEKRPYAVMLAADKVAKPLSGISQADVVVEMPVLTNGITRYMAVFQCEEPQEIGSVRSARHDFIPFAESFDAIFAHWGGSYLALEKLNDHVIDNIDALKDKYENFYRKANAKAPHNGFTSFPRMQTTSEKFKYRQTINFKEYSFKEDKSATEQQYDIMIGYPSPSDVKFRYNPDRNSYSRFSGGFKEIDKINNRQVEVKNLIVMTADSKQVNIDYNDVDIEDKGDAVVYRNGEIIKGKWERKNKRYAFLDSSGKEIEFTPGKIWISVVQPDQQVLIKNL